jgi:hypothetical protein
MQEMKVKCAICLSYFEENQKTVQPFSQCEHTFQEDCKEPWTAENYTGPICRREDLIPCAEIVGPEEQVFRSDRLVLQSWYLEEQWSRLERLASRPKKWFSRLMVQLHGHHEDESGHCKRPDLGIEDSLNHLEQKFAFHDERLCCLERLASAPEIVVRASLSVRLT